MGERQQVSMLKGLPRPKLIEQLFKQEIPDDVWVRENPRGRVHYHSYGGNTPFFKGLTEGKLLGTKCGEEECKDTGIWLPPRVDCPDCWNKTRWVDIDISEAKVYTYSTTNYPGALFKLTTPCPLISLEIPGVCTKFMSYLSEFKEGEPYIGMRVKPVFKIKRPTYSILDISWVPVD